MSDPVTMARAARESLARGLGALQGDPTVPPQLVELAAPIAQAMGALHQIERSGGAQVAPHAQTALAAVQSALAQLQGQPQSLPAVLAATEAVAGALGGVHALARLQPAAAAPRPAPQPAPQPVAAPAPQPIAAPAPQPVAYAPPPQPAQPAQAYAQPPAPYPNQQPAQQQPTGGAPSPYAPTALQPQAPAAAPPQAVQGLSPPGADVPVVAAELGAFSPSNFYKGLSGNDIVDHGGIFVSTYKLPKLGARVRLKVSMPGGYEFEANGLVRWRREANEASTDAPPGFGAQLTEITPEARQLVYRYVRNREPMFHDDL